MPDDSIQSLSYSVPSLAGAMGTWPLRSIRWHCRVLRANEADPHVLEALYAKDVSDIVDLEDMATDLGVGTATLRAKRGAIKRSDVREIEEMIKEEYKGMHGGEDNYHGCPFEESGKNNDCHNCPLAGNVLDRLMDQ